MGRSAAKRELILKKAKEVFIEMGYSRVTMKDIVEACGISRGGLYLYYSSVKDIFIEVILKRNASKLDRLKEDIIGDEDFIQILDTFFAQQTHRLLHIETSLMPAMYEFFLAHKGDVEKEFFVTQFQNSKKLIYEILHYGAEKNYLAEEKVNVMAEHITFLIEGLGTLAMSSGVTRQMLDEHFALTKEMVLAGYHTK